MTDPTRNDIFEDANGVQIAVKQVYPPNALGVALVEYKNLSDSNLRFMPKEQFLEYFHWVGNFGTTDTFVKVVMQKAEQLQQAFARHHTVGYGSHCPAWQLKKHKLQAYQVKVQGHA